MTSFVDRVVARGAGLPLLERAATLRLRPVSSFEAGNAGTLLTGRVDPIDDAPRIPSSPASSSRERPAQYEPAARRLAAADPFPSSFDTPEPTGEETTPRQRVPTEGWNDSFDVSANRHGATRKQASAAERSSDPVVEVSPPVRSDGDNLKIQAQPIREERPSVEAIAYQPRDSIPDAAPTSAEIMPKASTLGWSEAPSLGRREAPSFAMAETQTPVTVTVGRIDVQFLLPPAPPAASPSAPRSSGFGTYARARRGIPR